MDRRARGALQASAEADSKGAGPAGRSILMMEFHISRKARERYQFAESLFSYTGNVVFANLAACREFAHRMNKVRERKTIPSRRFMPGKLYAMGLIDEASHVLMARYREQFDPEVMTAALDWFSAQVGAEKLDTMLLAFVEQFPGTSVIRGAGDAARMAGRPDGRDAPPGGRAGRVAAAVDRQPQRGLQALRGAV